MNDPTSSSDGSWLSQRIVSLVEAGRTEVVESILAEYPDLHHDEQRLLECIDTEYCARKERGQSPVIGEYLQRFPACALRLTKLFEGYVTNRQQSLEEQSLATLNSNPPETLAAINDALPSLPTDAVNSPRVNVTVVSGRIGDYEIIREIARGGMGVVYQARHVSLGRMAAVKLIRSGEFAGQQEVRRFQLEAEAAAKLEHPGIVQIYEVGQHAGQPFLALAYVDGQSLWQRVKETPLEPKLAARLMQQVAEAVEYAHSRGIIHRDLKPQNILLTKDDQPRVTDFGLAKNQAGDSSLTASGDVLGTPSYMPPEQASGKLDQVGPSADVYSLGATLYCLLTRRPPFQAASSLETLKQVVEQEPASPRLLNPSVDRDLDTICLKCLQKSASNRFVTAQDLADELGRYLRGEPIRSRPVSLVSRVWRWCRRNPLGTALVASLLAGVTALGISAVFIQRARELSDLKDRLQVTIDRPELSQAYLGLGEGLIVQMETLAPGQTKQNQDRLWGAYADLVELRLKSTQVTPTELEQLDATLDLLSTRSKDRAQKLRDLLARRRQAWQPVFMLKAPFQDLREFFEDSQLQIVDQAIEARPAVPLNDDRPAVSVRSRSTGSGALRLEAVYDDRWRAARQLTLELTASDQVGYKFTLLPVTLRLSAGEVSQAEVEQSDGSTPKDYSVQIHRNGKLLKQQHVSGKGLANEPHLTVGVTRQGRKLSVQLGTETTITLDDPFPLAGSIELRYGVGLPEHVGLVQLTASQMRLAGSITPLEQGDELFDEGSWNKALDSYREQGLSATSREIIGECQYKQALCLVQTGQLTDATELLEKCFVEPSRWAALAGVQLWVQSLRERRLSEADEILERLSRESKSGYEVAAMVSEEVRQEILRAYRERHPRRSIQSYSFQRSLLLEFRKWFDVEELLGSGGADQIAHFGFLRDNFFRAGAYDDAVRANQKCLLKNQFDDGALQFEIAINRRRSAIRDAVTLADKYTLDETGFVKHGVSGGLLLERAYCYAALHDWDQVERVLDPLLRLSASHVGNAFSWRVALLQYFLLARRGDIDGAREALHSALTTTSLSSENKKNEAGELQISGSGTLLEHGLIRGLQGDLSESEVGAMLGKLNGSGGGTLGSVLTSVINPQSLVAPINELFRSPKGRASAHKWILDQGSYLERSHELFVRLATEYIRAHAFGGNISETQEVAVESFGKDVLIAVTQEGELTTSQIAFIGATWKGFSNMLGWKAVASSLSPKLRQSFAYVFAHRYLSLNKPAQTMAFLEEVCAIKVGDPAIVKLASEDLELLKSRHGRLEIVNQYWRPVRVSLRFPGQEPKFVEVADKATVALAEGEYGVDLVEPIPGVSIASSRVSIKTGRRHTATIVNAWWAGAADASLPGLVDRPAPLPGICRWQMVFAESDNWSSFAVTPDGSHVAIGDEDGIVRSHRFSDFSLRQLIPTDSGPMNSLVWNASGDTLAMASTRSPKIRLWNQAESKLGPVLMGHLSGVTCLAWSPDGKRLASGGDWGDGTIHVWDPFRIGSLTFVNGSSLRALAWSPDGRMLAATSVLPTIEILSDELKRLLQFENAEKVSVVSLAWHPSEQTLAAGSGNQSIQSYTVTSEPVIAKLTHVNREFHTVNSMSWDRGGGRLLLGQQDGHIRCCTVGSEGLSNLWLSPPHAPFPQVAWVAPEQQLAVSLQDSCLRTWDDHGKCVAERRPATSLLVSVELAPGIPLLSGRQPNGRVGLFDLSGNRLRLLPDVISRRAPCFSPDGKKIAVADDITQRIRIYDVAAEQEVIHLSEPAGRVQSLAWDNTAQRLAVCLEDGKVWICPIDNSAAELLPLTFPASDVAWQPGGARLAIAAYQAGARVIYWDVETKKIHADIQVSPQAGVRQLAWSPDGQSLAVVHSAIQILDAEGRRGVVVTELPLGMNQIRWSDDSRSLATVGADRMCHIWKSNGTVMPKLTAGSSSQVLALTNRRNEMLLWSRSGLERRSTTAGDQLQRIVMWPDGESIEMRNSGAVLRCTAEARNRVRFVVELTGQRLETLTWQQFEERIGMPLGDTYAPVVDAN